MDKRHCEANLTAFLNRYPERQCQVYLLHGALTEGEMTSLYTHPKIKAIVSTSHGEGFGLPLFEAAYNALPVIAPDWSGQKDFLYAPRKDKKTKKIKEKPFFAKVDYTLETVHPSAVWENVIVADSQWAEIKENSYKTCLRKLYKDYKTYKALANKLKKHLREELSPEAQNAKFIEALDVASESAPLEDVQVYG